MLPPRHWFKGTIKGRTWRVVELQERVNVVKQTLLYNITPDLTHNCRFGRIAQYFPGCTSKFGWHSRWSSSTEAGPHPIAFAMSHQVNQRFNSLCDVRAGWLCHLKLIFFCWRGCQKNLVKIGQLNFHMRLALTIAGRFRRTNCKTPRTFYRLRFRQIHS